MTLPARDKLPTGHLGRPTMSKMAPPVDATRFRMLARREHSHEPVRWVCDGKFQIQNSKFELRLSYDLPMTVDIRVRRLPHAEGLPLPVYATGGAAGADLCAAVDR